MIIEKRSVPLSVFLSIITCGIYGIYWEYKILDDLYKANGVASTAGTDIVISIVTCGLYGIYLNYKKGKLICAARERCNLPYKDLSTMFIIVSIVGRAISGVSNAGSSVSNLNYSDYSDIFNSVSIFAAGIGFVVAIASLVLSFIVQCVSQTELNDYIADPANSLWWGDNKNN